MHRDGRIFPAEVSLSQTTHGTGNETTTSKLKEGGRLSDIYGELSDLLTNVGRRSTIVHRRPLPTIFVDSQSKA